jgi:hypothetical protein
MSADEDACRSNFAENVIERFPTAARIDRIDPDQHCVHPAQALSKRVGMCFVIRRWLRSQAPAVQSLEDGFEPAGLGLRRVARALGAAPDDSHAISRRIFGPRHVQRSPDSQRRIARLHCEFALFFGTFIVSSAARSELAPRSARRQPVRSLP